MSLSEQTPRVDATLLTATDAIAFAYPFADADELLVVSDGRGVLTRVTHYTVTGEGEAAGGTVTMVGGTVGEKITIVRNTPISQTLTLRVNGKYFVTDVTAALDKLTKLAQETREILDRAPKTSVSDGGSYEFPDAAERAGKAVRFDDNGDLDVTGELGVWKGEWATDTVYYQYDYFKVTDGNGIATVYIVEDDHTSTSISADLSANDISVLIDGSAISTALTAAEAAQSASEAAQLAAELAQTGSETAEINAEAALAYFETLYLGAFATNPTEDNEGNALADGALYWNTSTKALLVYDESESSWAYPLSETVLAEVRKIAVHANMTFFQIAADDTIKGALIEGELEASDVSSGLAHASIGNAVTSIGSYAFYSKSLTSVTIPDSVTTIGDYAFADNSLTSVTIPDSVTTIGSNAFTDNSLTSVTIPDSVTSIQNGAFYSNSLTSVTIPDSVTSIGSYAFFDNSLTSVTIPDSVTTIQNGAFADNSLTSVTIPDSVTTIGSSAFYVNSLTSVTIPDSVTTIGSSAFRVNSLTSVTIPDSVTTIGSNAFRLNSLTSVTIPDSVTTIGSSAFRLNSLTSVTIPDSVTSIQNGAFADNSQLSDVTAHITKTIFDTGANILASTAAALTLRVPAGDSTWDALQAANPSPYQGNAAVTVVRI